MADYIMKQYRMAFMAAALAAGTLAARGQMGGPAQLSAGMGQFFGANQAFSAQVTVEVGNAGGTVTTPGKIYFDHGNTRMDMDVAEMRGAAVSRIALERLGSMGMDEVVTISLADEKTGYLIYPHAQACIPFSPEAAGTNATTMTMTPTGKETVAGQPCVKNSAVVAGPLGVKSDYTVWTATGLRNFPVQIAAADEVTPVTFIFSNVDFSAPAPELFQPPTGYIRYNSVPEMMRAVVMKQLRATSNK